MINKYTNKQRGLLAVIMAMVMVFAGAAFVAAEVDAIESNDVQEVDTFDELKTAIGNGGMIEVTGDITVTEQLEIKKTVTISGDYSLNGSGVTRIFNITGVSGDITVTIKDLKIDNSTGERGISAFDNPGKIDIVLENVEVSAKNYAINVAKDNKDISVSMTGGKVTGWAVYQTWSKDSEATFEDVEFESKNNQTDTTSNDFDMFVINYWETTSSGINYVDTSGSSITIDGCSLLVENLGAEYAKQGIVDVRCEGCIVTIKDTTIDTTETTGVMLSEADSDIILDGKIEIKGVLNSESVLIIGDNASIIATEGSEIDATFSDGVNEIKVNSVAGNDGLEINSSLEVVGGIFSGENDVSVGTSDSGFTINNGELILNNYNGDAIFSDIVGVVVIGDNTITVESDDPLVALQGEIEYIKTVQGTGSLTIVLSGEALVMTGIDSTADEMDINGVTVTIEIDNSYEDDNASAAMVSGLIAPKIEVLYSSVSITTSSMSNLSVGVLTTEMKLTKSSLNIEAGLIGIATLTTSTTGEGESAQTTITDVGKMVVANSVVDVSAGFVGVITKMTVTNESTITMGADGDVTFMDGLSGLATGFVGSFNVSQESQFTADNMMLIGGSTNDAIVTNNGNMVIHRSASFTNNATFTNNGVVGIYGTFVNASGETINNGEMNTYAYYVDEIIYTDADATIGDVSISITLTIPMADGTFFTIGTIEFMEEDIEVTEDFVGTITVSEVKTVLKATSDNGKIDISVSNNGLFGITITSAQLSVTDKKDPGFNINGIKETLDGIIVDSEGVVTVVGGKMSNNGTMDLGTNQPQLIAAGELVNSGEIVAAGDITTLGGKLNGNAIALSEGATVTLSGDVDVSFTYAGEYTYDDEDDKEVNVTYDNELKISGSCSALVFIAGDEPTDAEGYAAFIINNLAAEEDKSVTVTAVKGAVYASGSPIAQDAVLEILSGVVFEAQSDVTLDNGVLAVQDGAVLNIRGEAVESYSYGKLVYVISFAKDGYTYYGSLTYALANASEGMTLVLNSTAPIVEDLTVGKGITLQFAKNAALIIGTTEKDITITMSEDAKFEFTDKTNSITANGNVKLSGTFVYDGNELILDSIAFVSGNGIVCNAATKTEVSNIALTVSDIDAGTVKAQVGTVKLSATFSENTTDKTASALVIAEGATVIETAVAMNAGASVTIDGTYKPAANESIASAIVGTGSIVLEEGNSVEFTGTKAFSTSVSNGTDSLGMEAIIINDKDAATATNYVVTITSVAKAGTKAAYLDITGVLFSGSVTVVGNAGLSDLDVGKDAVVTIPAESIATVLEESTATGLVKVAGTINMYTEDTKSYGKLVYEITYTDGEYTVYTVVGTAVENAKAGDVFTLTDDLNVEEKLEVPSGVTIIVPEGKKISLGADEYLLVGTPMTTLGATGGIQGTVELNADAFVVEYADISMDNSTMKIVGPTTESKIVDSQVSVLNQLYATVYALKDAVYFSDVADMVEPEIDGYRFVKFTDSIGNEIVTKNISVTPAVGTQIGSTDIVANMKANMVQVTFTAVEGLTYYVNNLAQNTVGAPVYVEYGSTITAAPVVGYTGTALVNGQSYIVVDSETSVITGSGVTEKVTEIVTEDEGMELTDILLIVLVVLIVIMAIIIALRMMRS